MPAPEPVAYLHDRVTCRGELYRAATPGPPRPAVLLAPTWWGLDGFARQAASSFAALGYHCLALDPYGEGATARTEGEAENLMRPLDRDRVLLRGRLAAALGALRRLPGVDAGRVAAVGYCFGGLCVLEMARAGMDLRGVVSFHGLLHTPRPAGAGEIRCPVLVLHGYQDPLVPPSKATAFQQEMTRAGADWQMVLYGGAVHGFTNPAAADPSGAVAYEPRAARRSAEAARVFLAEVLRS